MKILVIGSGGREHTLVWKLKQCATVSRLYCAPGNPGIAALGECVPIQVDQIKALRDFALEKQVDLTVVGPEVPLTLGIVDEFRQVGLQIIGPDAKAAQLEGSKSYAKDFMVKYGIPTGRYEKAHTMEEALYLLQDFSLPVVIKADGLAAGKGVLICQTPDEARQAVVDILVNQVFGEAGSHLVIEEFLEGIETSVLCFVDGETILPMASSQDHKRIGDGDTGPNTGGMGTYSPNRVYTNAMARQVKEKILIPTLRGIQQEKMDFRGILFVGLMITHEGPKVLEYNVRFGDPETQVVMPRLKTDLCKVFSQMLNRNLSRLQLEWKPEVAVCAVLASGGYPGDYATGIPISGLEEVAEDILVFHAGTGMKEEQLVTAGGRVLNVTALAPTVDEAREKVYNAVERITFEGKTYRRDIGLT
ncbi:phosphoribosylamine--glycine ligase [Anoxynatronum buryatiense]|uniref:Phosphoribosylamine--glycine ligase n=1 Tax=Anoxynatronum buryatiense TaxID=489973 RepID=A0AA45WWH2_9CLOT|nr:phosphoribosylamine--glycine ligase [Anoxynatronum buryatiense]SMP59939.1 phosphoribosylamine--glycine ligase [Anoxynatronum buryatiense]